MAQPHVLTCVFSSTATIFRTGNNRTVLTWNVLQPGRNTLLVFYAGNTQLTVDNARLAEF